MTNAHWKLREWRLQKIVLNWTNWYKFDIPTYRSIFGEPSLDLFDFPYFGRKPISFYNYIMPPATQDRHFLWTWNFTDNNEQELALWNRSQQISQSARAVTQSSRRILYTKALIGDQEKHSPILPMALRSIFRSEASTTSRFLLSHFAGHSSAASHSCLWLRTHMQSVGWRYR